ncbi:hypothetical protein AB0P36_22075 [Streptomyces flavidovirens]|uniref:Vgb family protein n=1 Tax=Streptomyces flavidovirens TaxID=67298 RepID=UPI003432B310
MRNHKMRAGAMVVALAVSPLLYAGSFATAANAAPVAAVQEGPAVQQGEVDCPSAGCRQIVTGVSAWGVALDKTARKLYVGDEAADTLWEIDLDTGRKHEVAKGMDARGVAVDGAGSAYVADPHHDVLWRVDLNRGTKERVAEHMGDATGVALDGSGKAYVTDTWGDQLWEVDLTTGRKHPVATGLGDAQGVALDGEGRAYVTDSWGDKLWEVDLTTGRKHEVATGLADAMGVAIGGDRQAYVTDSWGNRLWRVDLDRGTKENLVTGMSDPRHLVIDQNGHFYVADSHRNVVWHITGHTVTPPGRTQVSLSPVPFRKAVPGGIATPAVTVTNTSSVRAGTTDVVLTLGPKGVSWLNPQEIYVTQDGTERKTRCTIDPGDSRQAICKGVNLSLNPQQSAELHTEVRTSSTLRPGEMPKVTFRIGEASADADFLMVDRGAGHAQG